MKNIIFSFLLLVYGLGLNAQNAFYDAKRFSSKTTYYQDFSTEVKTEKKILQDSFSQRRIQGPAPNDIALRFPGEAGLRLGLDLLSNTEDFIANPFDTTVILTALPSIEAMINIPFLMLQVPIYPFLDGTSIFHNALTGKPILKYNQSEYQFVQLNEGEESPSYCIDPETGLAIDESLKDKVIAAFNPITGAFHKKSAQGFETEASAYINSLDNKIYTDRHRKEIRTDYNYKDNGIYQQHKAIVIIYQAGPDSIKVGRFDPSFLETDVKEDSAEKVFSGMPSSYSAKVLAPSASQSGSSSPTTSPFSPTAAIDAIAQFLVGRVKEELTMAFFDEFLEKLDNSSEMRHLFPNTHYLLQHQDIFRVPSMGEMWVNAFQDDIESLVPNVGTLIENDPQYFKYKNDVSVKSFRFAYHTVDGALKGDNFQQIVGDLDETLGGLEDEVGLSIRAISILCENLMDINSNSTTNAFISKGEFNSLDKLGGTYFVAFLFQRNKTFFDALQVDGQPLSGFIAEHSSAFTKTTEQFVDLLEEVKKAENNLTTSYADSDKQSINLLYIHAAETILKTVEFGYTLKHFSKPEALYEDEFYLTYKPATHSIFQAIKAHQFKDQPRLLLHTMQAISPIFESLSRQVEKDILNHKGDVAQLEQKNKRLKFYKTFVKELGFYGGFMVDILAARSSNQIRGILDSYALPAGSYRIKRNAPFSIDLNAYPGIYTGLEFSKSLGKDNGAGVFGVTAPLGFALSWGQKRYSKRSKGGQSFSLFVPVIDIGAAFSYRWNNDAEGFPEEIKWEQVLSPGLYAVWGFRKMPIALSIGAQYTPSLRKITVDEVELEGNALRIGVNLAVDIPIFNFYHKED